MDEIMTKENLVNPRQKFNQRTIHAVKRLAQAKPWRGEWEKRWVDLQACFRELAASYDLAGWKLIHEGRRSGDSGGSRIDLDAQAIVLTGRLSVVSLFFLIGLARFHGDSPRAMTWAVTLFARRFPISFARCELRGGLLVNPNRRAD